jgi:hypothetical protein
LFWLCLSCGILGWWQGDESRLVHAQHDDPTAHGAQAPIGSTPVEILADQLGEVTPRGLGMVTDDGPDAIHVGHRKPTIAPDTFVVG